VQAFARNYLRRIFGTRRYVCSSFLANCWNSPSIGPLLSTPHTSPAKSTPAPSLKRERTDSFTSDKSNDEQCYRDATYLLNFASPEAISLPGSLTTPPSRKKARSRYANTLSVPLSQAVRPAYEDMPEPDPLASVRYIPHGYNVPESPPQSPPEMTTRLRARPYYPV
jgi:hypothetical protein